MTFERRPTRVAVGAPDGAAFAIPDAYEEVLPSVFEERVLRSKAREERGRDAAERLVVPEGVMSRWRRDDDRYRDLRKR